MPESMPTLFLVGSIHCGPYGLFLRMNIALRDVHVAMAGQVSECPRIHVRRPSREAGVPKRVELERRKLRVLLVSFFSQNPRDSASPFLVR